MPLFVCLLNLRAAVMQSLCELASGLSGDGDVEQRVAGQEHGLSGRSLCHSQDQQKINSMTSEARGLAVVPEGHHKSIQMFDPFTERCLRLYVSRLLCCMSKRFCPRPEYSVRYCRAFHLGCRRH